MSGRPEFFNLTLYLNNPAPARPGAGSKGPIRPPADLSHQQVVEKLVLYPVVTSGLFPDSTYFNTIDFNKEGLCIV